MYLRTVGPFYGFFGLGLALYFASQRAGRLFWPLTAGFLRMLVAIGGGLASAAAHWLAFLVIRRASARSGAIRHNYPYRRYVRRMV